MTPRHPHRKHWNPFRYFDEKLGSRVFDAVVRLPLKTGGDGDGLSAH